MSSHFLSHNFSQSLWDVDRLKFSENTASLCVCLCMLVFVCVFGVAMSEVGSRPYIDSITAAIVQPHPCFLTLLSSLTDVTLLQLFLRGFNRFHVLVSPPVFFCPFPSSSPALPPLPIPPSYHPTIPPSFPPLFPLSPPPAEKVTPRHKQPPSRLFLSLPFLSV